MAITSRNDCNEIEMMEGIRTRHIERPTRRSLQVIENSNEVHFQNAATRCVLVNDVVLRLVLFGERSLRDNIAEITGMKVRYLTFTNVLHKAGRA